MSTLLRLAATTAATSSPTARTLTGLAVPYGPVGHASLGDVTFTAGSIRLPADLGRIKLLEQHNTDRSIGYLSSADDTPQGLRCTFTVPESPEGDRALQMAADGRRDGLSVGVRLDEDVLAEITRKWWEDDTTPTAATGELVEVSSVTIPAFADARVDGSAALAAALADGVMPVVFTHHRPTTASALDSEGAPMAPGTITPAQLSAPAVAPAVATAATPDPSAAAAAPSPFAGGATTVVLGEAPVYTFDGRGPSFVRDAWAVRTREGTELAEALARWERFNRAIAQASPAQLGALLRVWGHPHLEAAVETRVTAPNFINQGYKPELLVEAIDKGRPIISRLSTVPLTDATPYRVPVEGEYFYRGTLVTDGATTAASTTVTSATAAFTAADLGLPISGGSIPVNATIVKINSATSVVISAAATATAAGVSITISRPAVSDHTEGQSHTTEGDIDVADVTINPGAVSGAFRLSRELIDASNPALDRIALRAMLRTYRYVTEVKAVAAIDAGIDTTVAAQNTNAKVRASLSTFYDLADEPADFLVLGSGYYNTLANEVDGTGRPMLPPINPVNAFGTASAGWTGASIDGVELVKSSRIDLETGYPVVAADIHIGESAVKTFRFEEVEGPGIVKLALWGYFAAKVLRVGATRKFKSV